MQRSTLIGAILLILAIAVTVALDYRFEPKPTMPNWTLSAQPHN